MVISHEHKYLFIELPRTGSTAISRELCQYYGGKRILRKHATYHDFLKQASPEERQYFVFSGIRNPLDDIVSHYFKLKTNHREFYTDPNAKKKFRLAEMLDKRLFNQIQKHNLSFEEFFLKFYVFPYNNWASSARKHYDYIIRFENISQDFAKVISLLGLDLARPLPARNSTSDRERSFASYYTPRAIAHARRIFGPFMKEWGYEFPPEWGSMELSRWNEIEFQLTTTFRQIYWIFLRRYI